MLPISSIMNKNLSRYIINLDEALKAAPIDRYYLRIECDGRMFYILENKISSENEGFTIYTYEVSGKIDIALYVKSEILHEMKKEGPFNTDEYISECMYQWAKLKLLEKNASRYKD